MPGTRSFVPDRTQRIHNLARITATASGTVALREHYDETDELPGNVAGHLVELRNDLRRELNEKLPSPSEARAKAFATGKHTLDRNGIYQPPVTKERQAELRERGRTLHPLVEFLWNGISSYRRDRQPTGSNANGFKMKVFPPTFDALLNG